MRLKIQNESYWNIKSHSAALADSIARRADDSGVGGDVAAVVGCDVRLFKVQSGEKFKARKVAF